VGDSGYKPICLNSYTHIDISMTEDIIDIVNAMGFEKGGAYMINVMHPHNKLMSQEHFEKIRDYIEKFARDNDFNILVVTNVELSEIKIFKDG